MTNENTENIDKEKLLLVKKGYFLGATIGVIILAIVVSNFSCSDNN